MRAKTKKGAVMLSFVAAPGALVLRRPGKPVLPASSESVMIETKAEAEL